MAEVTIIGAGNMARGIATRLLAGGAQVQILSPDARDAASLAGELAERGGGSASGAGVEQPLTGEVVVLATPYEAGDRRRAG